MGVDDAENNILYYEYGLNNIRLQPAGFNSKRSGPTRLMMKSQIQYWERVRMIKTKCFFCKKNYTIDYSDAQYQKIKRNPKAHYVCKKCNESMQREAQSSTGLDPDVIDKYDKFLR